MGGWETKPGGDLEQQTSGGGARGATSEPPGKRTLTEQLLDGHTSISTPPTRQPDDVARPPKLRLDKSRDAQRLHTLVAMRQQETVVQLLEQNAHPEHMYALHRAYGSSMVPDVLGVLTEASYVARATTAGVFVRPPAQAEEMYNPAVHGRSDGGVFTVTRAPRR